MGMTTGIVTTGGSPVSGAKIEFRKGTANMGTATADGTGRYAIYLAASLYNAYCTSVNPEQACHENPLVIPAGTKIQNLSY
jgi:hypothetical protein